MSLLSDDDWAEVESDGIAAEYALGLLTAQEAAAAEEVMALDPETARAVAEWTVTFAALSKAGVPRQPSPELRARICDAGAVPTFEASPSRALRGRLRHLFWGPGARLRSLWRASVIATALFAVAVAGWVVMSWLGPDYQADIPGSATVPALTLYLDASNDSLTVTPTGGRVSLIPPFGKTFVLWADGREAPVYIGAVDPSGQLTAPLPPGISAGPVSVMVTLENRAAENRAARQGDGPSRAVVARTQLSPVP